MKPTRSETSPRGRLPTYLLPAAGNQAALMHKPKLGGFNAWFAVSTAYQTQLPILSTSHEGRLKEF